MITIQQLANEMGVSTATVSRALNDRGRMSDETREKIKKAAKKHNYRPSFVAQNLISQRTYTIGVVVPMMGDTNYSGIVNGIEKAAFDRGYNIILCDTKLDVEREKTYIDMLIRRRVEGVLIVPFAAGDPAAFRQGLDELQAYRIPVVLMEDDPGIEGISKVMVDNYTAAKKAVRHLVDLGHRNIGFLRYKPESWDHNADQRQSGFMDALRENNLPAGDANILHVGSLLGGEERCNGENIRQFLTGPDAPTAIFVVHDWLAATTIGLMREWGMRVPEDVSVVGFDDTSAASLISPSLTTIHQPAKELGETAAELLFTRLQQGEALQDWPRSVHLSADLIVRNSTGKKKSG